MKLTERRLKKIVKEEVRRFQENYDFRQDPESRRDEFHAYMKAELKHLAELYSGVKEQNIFVSYDAVDPRAHVYTLIVEIEDEAFSGDLTPQDVTERIKSLVSTQGDVSDVGGVDHYENEYRDYDTWEVEFRA